MTVKFSEARKKAFLDALRATANQTLAAERAKVSRSWVQLHRSGDPAFRLAVEEATAEAKAALRDAALPPSSGQASTGSAAPQDERGSNKPPRGWGFLDGAELVVKGTNGRRTQIARARIRQWTPRVEARFLAALAATCNVRASCAEVGMSYASAYAHRDRWPDFARRWDAAVQRGYERIDGGLTANAIRLFQPDNPPPELPLPPMTVDDAIRIVRVHDRRRREAGLDRR